MPEANLYGAAVATKITRILPRTGGGEAKIVAERMFGLGLHASVEVTVYRRASPDQPWHLCSKAPAPNWRTMSVEEYKARGRSEVLQTVTHGEIFAVTNLLGRPMAEFEAQAPQLAA